MKTRFIFNPASGHCRNRPEWERSLRQRVAAKSSQWEFCRTAHPGHATALAHQAVAAGFSQLVAVGGDGTINEIAQALVGTDVTLALLPAGSGNGLASHLGVPRQLERALNLIDGSEPAVRRWIDIGEVNGHAFLNVMGLGLDADVSRRFNQLVRRGLPAYVRTACAALRHRRSERVWVDTGGAAESVEVLLLAVANSDQYGNAARIAPGARVDDGELDLIAVGPVPLWQGALLALRLFTGGIDGSRHVRRLSSARYLIQRERPGIIHTDGETREADAQLEIVVRARSLRVLVPLGATRRLEKARSFFRSNAEEKRGPSPILDRP